MFASSVDPSRYERTNALMELLAGNLRQPATILELGCGPGSLVGRILRRFPRATVVAVDTDPVLLQIGRQAFLHGEGRVAWMLADLRNEGWSAELPDRRFHAVVSSLALHWLEKEEIREVYRRARELLRPSGVMINADYLPSNRRTKGGSECGAGDSDVAGQKSRGNNVRAFQRSWTIWWDAVAATPSMREAVRERAKRLPGSIPPRRTTGPKNPAPLEFHLRSLVAAGFHQVEVPWEQGEFRAVMGRA